MYSTLLVATFKYQPEVIPNLEVTPLITDIVFLLQSQNISIELMSGMEIVYININYIYP